MTETWNTLAGDLRSSLAARDWHQAGAIVWQLRQLDGERFTLELEHYTNEQVRKGGYGMTLETEQRLEAVRQWAREVVQGGDASQIAALRLTLNGRGFSQGTFQNAFDDGSNQIDDLRDLLDLQFAGSGMLKTTRTDMQDVIWSVLQDA